MASPLIGITVSNRDNDASNGRYDAKVAYSRAVVRTGGVPIYLPHEPQFAQRYVAICDGIIITGGADPDTAPFGEPPHPLARKIDVRRQAFESALIQAIQHDARRPATMGVCLGMQMLALHAGGKLDQYMPDTIGQPATDRHIDKPHTIALCAGDSILSRLDSPNAPVFSSHRQRVIDAGRMRVIAKADDGTVEAIDDPDHPFYLGVQWHPEDTDGPFGDALIERFVHAAGLVA
jgi:putative glutamine amidotransferase